MLTVACYLVVEQELGLDLVSGWWVVMHTYFYQCCLQALKSKAKYFIERSFSCRIHSLLRLTVGGLAQWLERRSVAGELSLIYAWSMVDMWPLRVSGVLYGSTNQANSAFHSFRVSKWVVIHVIAWITEVETIKRQAWTVRVVVYLWG